MPQAGATAGKLHYRCAAGRLPTALSMNTPAAVARKSQY
ncbi:hypothetical protein AEST_02440 [Alishewanella aestuarii B11]|uniref:Uncharacterized protein n=1 Tax=Alishewanella aestuarii B11 TaxID=1197174 RepID=J1Q680_9ALTE|nr:hypothetical protein AEST_02440 [Alishewanella aestuarii B11]